jgi:hypothetical protein
MPGTGPDSRTDLAGSGEGVGEDCVSSLGARYAAKEDSVIERSADGRRPS